MGYFINPPDMTKEEFIAKHTIEVVRNFRGKAHEIFSSRNKNEAIVVLVDNGPFTAAGIAFDENELAAFIDNPRDYRPMCVFVLPKAVLKPYYDFDKNKEKQ
jgi:hypothetical protein